MQVQVSTDNHIHGSKELIESITASVENGLERFRDQLTRVEVHLADVNGPKGPEGDKRCIIEARLAGRQPTAVTEHASSVLEAVDGALEKLHHLLDSLLDKLHNPKGRTSFGGDQTI
ncbi:MAG: HPF/RaiA family ribosome-associated protein [Isosphaeraceae bacterium]